MHISLCKLVTPNWSGWEVALVIGGRHVSSVIYEHTRMYNYYPRTEAQQIEKEAREGAEGMAQRLGLPIVQTLIDGATENVDAAPSKS